MKDQIQKKRARELAAIQKVQECQEAAAESPIPPEDESDSDDEEVYEARRRKETAQQHWSIIRRDIQERIRIRKENNPANKAWNALREQLRAMTRGDNVRRELYERYGIVPKVGQKIPEDEMKPRLSCDLKELVNRFQSVHIKRLRIAFT